MPTSKTTNNKKERRSFHIVGDVDKASVIKEKDIEIAGISGAEKVYYENFNLYDLEDSIEDEPIYKSEIIIGGKLFDVFIKFNQGRKNDKPVHLIITIEGSRRSLGFYKGIKEALRKVKMFVYNNVTNLNPPSNIS